uniref:Uncharacterized protein n=1 Tax=Oryza brachyantha TaxID=4533 RepID=J3MVD8_ORYBR
MKRSLVITCHTNDVYLALSSFLFFTTKFCCRPNKTQLMVLCYYLCHCFLSWFLLFFIGKCFGRKAGFYYYVKPVVIPVTYIFIITYFKKVSCSPKGINK